jgi:hypothetical protein
VQTALQFCNRLPIGAACVKLRGCSGVQSNCRAPFLLGNPPRLQVNGMFFVYAHAEFCSDRHAAGASDRCSYDVCQQQGLMGQSSTASLGGNLADWTSKVEV